MKETRNTGIGFLYRNRKMLALSLILGAALGFGITFLIPEKYLSTAIIFPYNSHTRDELTSNPQFGFEVESEQLLQLLESQSMRNRTIEKFKLYDYYGMDTNSMKAWRSELVLKYIQDVQFLRSKYLSIVINVTMEDPQLAADIANFQVEEVDRYRTEIFENNRRTELHVLETEYNGCREVLNDLRDSIYALKGGGALLYNFLENLDNENYDPSDFVSDPRMEDIVERYVYEMRRYQTLRMKYDQMKKDIEAPLPTVYSIDKAEPSFKKISPSFALNTLIGAFLTFILTFTLRLLTDKWRQLRKDMA